MLTLNLYLILGFICCSAFGQQCFIPGYETNRTINLEIDSSVGSNATFWTTRIHNATGFWFLGPYTPDLIAVEKTWANNTYDVKFTTTANFTKNLQEYPELRTAFFRLDILCLSYNVIYNVTVNVKEATAPGDRNEFPPVFDRRAYSTTIRRNNSNSLIDLGIKVSDSDVNLQNANVFIRSSNPALNILTSLETSQNATSFVYDVKFISNLSAVQDGVTEVLLTADDGVHSTSAFLDLTVE